MVEHLLPKQRVASSNLVSRSTKLSDDLHKSKIKNVGPTAMKGETLPYPSAIDTFKRPLEDIK